MKDQAKPSDKLYNKYMDADTIKGMQKSFRNIKKAKKLKRQRETMIAHIAKVKKENEYREITKHFNEKDTKECVIFREINIIRNLQEQGIDIKDKDLRLLD